MCQQLENKIDICVMQEIEIMPEYNTGLLSFKGYTLIKEKNEVKMRTGMYIRNGINYSRKF